MSGSLAKRIEKLEAAMVQANPVRWTVHWVKPKAGDRPGSLGKTQKGEVCGQVTIAGPRDPRPHGTGL